MKIVVNALSVDNPSGRSVLLGHLREWAKWDDIAVSFVVLYRTGNADMIEELGPRVMWHECHLGRQNWAARAWWERQHLDQVVEKLEAGAYLAPSGIAASSLSVPQLIIAQNPWCLVDASHTGFADKFKAILQRWAYRKTVAKAEVILYVSRYLQNAYLENAGCDSDPGSGAILHNGLSADLLKLTEAFEPSETKRDGPIVCVSVYGQHKNVETLLAAYRMLRDRGEARPMKLIGGWPNDTYRRLIESEIRRHKLDGCVEILGHVSREQLLDAYREASVFALLSRCESFGIPAIEAQSFGTPVVSADCCAIPEICGTGGIFVDPDDAASAASAIGGLLNSEQEWRACSQRARDNSARFRWSEVTLPMRDYFQKLASGKPLRAQS